MCSLFGFSGGLLEPRTFKRVSCFSVYIHLSCCIREHLVVFIRAEFDGSPKNAYQFRLLKFYRMLLPIVYLHVSPIVCISAERLRKNCSTLLPTEHLTILLTHSSRFCTSMYRPLSNDILEIRVLKAIHEAAQRCPIPSYRVQHIFPQEPPNPVHAIATSYIALSYTWGNGSDVLPILTDGDLKYVTRNLYDALAALRADDLTSDLPVWADAICINQQDIFERNREVRRMAEVYRRAHGVIVWLGTVPTAWTFRNYCPPFDVNRHFPKQFIHSENDIQALDAKHDLSKDFLTVLAIFDRPYWRRIWILQELMMGDYDSIGFFWAGKIRPASDLEALMTHFELLYLQLSSTDAERQPLKFTARLDVLFDNPDNAKDPDLPDSAAGLSLASMKVVIRDQLIRDRLRALHADLDGIVVDKFLEAHARQVSFDVTAYLKSQSPDNMLYNMSSWEQAMAGLPDLVSSLERYADALATAERWRRYDEMFKLESAVRGHTSHLQGILYATTCDFSAAKDSCGHPEHDSDHFYHVMGQLMEGECTDKRDFVYGVLGLLGSNLTRHIVVDYAINACAVFCSFTAALIRERGLNVLCEYTTIAQGSSPDLPSWVIMLDTHARERSQKGTWSNWREFCAGGSAVTNHDFSSDTKQLTCSAFMLKSGGTSSPLRYQNQNQTAKAVRALLRSDRTDKSSAEGRYVEQRQQKRGDDLIQYMWAEICRTYSTFQVGGTDLTSILEAFVHEHGDGKQGVNLIVDATWLRFIFLSSDGRLCLGPGKIEDQDVVAVLQGCNMPVVLRKCDDAYLFRGVCYVDGIMYGELVKDDTSWSRIAIC